MAPIFTGSKLGFGRSAEVAVAAPISATGGTVTTPGNGYTYHAFTSTGPSSFVVSDDGTGGSGADVTVLIVGGGGSGSGGWGGSGGGAGGVMYAST